MLVSFRKFMPGMLLSRLRRKKQKVNGSIFARQIEQNQKSSLQLFYSLRRAIYNFFLGRTQSIVDLLHGVFSQRGVI